MARSWRRVGSGSDRPSAVVCHGDRLGHVALSFTGVHRWDVRASLIGALVTVVVFFAAALSGACATVLSWILAVVAIVLAVLVVVAFGPDPSP
jgi:hypothetical protein